MNHDEKRKQVRGRIHDAYLKLFPGVEKAYTHKDLQRDRDDAMDALRYATEIKMDAEGLHIQRTIKDAEIVAPFKVQLMLESYTAMDTLRPTLKVWLHITPEPTIVYCHAEEVDQEIQDWLQGWKDAIEYIPHKIKNPSKEIAESLEYFMEVLYKRGMIVPTS